MLEQVIGHMPGYVPSYKLKHVPDMQVPKYMLKHVPKNVFRHVPDKYVIELVPGHVLKQMAHTFPMTLPQRTTD